MTITADIRSLVRARYKRCCAYCGVSETDVGGELEIDHFRPIVHGGTDHLDNLVYACTTCNRFKATYWVDQNVPIHRHLLHPGHDDVLQHIKENESGEFLGLSERGQFYIHWLRLNRPQLVELRLQRRHEQMLTINLEQIQAANQDLQSRIQLLEAELVELRQLISRLIGSN